MKMDSHNTAWIEQVNDLADTLIIYQVLDHTSLENLQQEDGQMVITIIDIFGTVHFLSMSTNHLEPWYRNQTGKTQYSRA
jgi:hypothetical protein